MRQLRLSLICLFLASITLWLVNYTYLSLKNNTSPTIKIIAPHEVQAFRISSIGKIQKIPINTLYDEGKRITGLIFAAPYAHTPNIKIIISNTYTQKLELKKVSWEKILTTPATDLLDNTSQKYSIYTYTFPQTPGSTISLMKTVPLIIIILLGSTLIGWALRKRIAASLALTLLILSLSIPILMSGYYDDDLYMDTSMKGKLALQETTYTSLIAQEVNHYLKNGRFTPIGHTASRTLFCFVENIFVYKLIILFMTACTFWLLFKFIGLYTKNAHLALVFIPLILQLRQYHDPLTSYFTLMQLLACFSLGAWIFLVQGLRTDKKQLIVFAGILQVFAALTFEAAYFMLPIPLFLLWLEKNNKKILHTLIYFLPTVLLLKFVSSIYQHAGTTQYIGLKANIEPLLIFKTWFLQTVATIPGIAVLSDPTILSTPILLQAHWIILILIVCITIAVLFYKLESLPQLKLQQTWPILLCAIALLTLPALSIATSIKYQSSLYLGIGYLPVFLQSLGLLCLLFIAIQGLKPQQRPPLLLLGIFVSGLVFANNIYTVSVRNQGIHAQRMVLKKAAQTGLFKDIPEHSTLVFTQGKLGHTDAYKYYLYYYTGKVFNCTHLENETTTMKNKYYLTITNTALLLEDHKK